MQQAYVAGAAETEQAKAVDAAKASEEALVDRQPPPPPKKKRPMEKGQGSKAINIVADSLADILLTPVNELTAAEDLENNSMRSWSSRHLSSTKRRRKFST